MSVKNAIHNYLNSVRQLTGADAVSLYLEVDSPRQLPLLFHVGDMAPVGELETEERAADFCTAVLQLQYANAAATQAFQFYPSRGQGGYLCCLDIQQLQSMLGPASVPEQRDNRRSSGKAGARSNLSRMLWLGLRYKQQSPHPVAEKYLNNPPPLTGKPPQTSEEWLFWTLGLGGQMAWEAYQQSLLPLDGITYLPGRVEFQAYLGREHDKALRDGQALGLLLINPDEFGLINHRLGQEAGDRALREIAALLTENLRQSDLVFRYGGAIFSVVMPGATRSAVNTVAEKLRKTLTQASFANNAARFSFSVGAAVCNASEEGDAQATEASDLLRRADQALNVAKLSGGARTVIWNPEGTEAGAGNLDRLSGIFTADTEKDYRNMLLLWETITVISSWSETDAIAQEFVERIGASVKPRQVGLFVNKDGEKGHLLAVSKSQPNHADRTSDKDLLLLSAAQKKLIDEAEQQGRTQRLRFGKGDSERGYIAYAIPLLSRQDCFGVLYLDGQEDMLRLDTSDLVFLDALASQIGVLLDRALLASRWKEEQLLESQRLLQEVKELRQSKRQSRLVYRSSSMKSVMSVLSKAAPTDITVLIGGESGTGKDMLARAVHDMSERKDKSFVTVDCGAIAQSLIDTELFGHKKGAYTGAQSASSGRIFQAQGGTLFLDEIGELPLDTQSKLLRLIQEKEITPVGGTSPIEVDVRIIAATNRDLAQEVDEGLFRRDLYYRLQVVTVTAPPLRERPEDILPLANYFLEQFVADYGKAGLAFNQAAEKVLQDYSWPGNVRELQNRVLQAVIMSDRHIIGWEELRLPVSLGLEAEPLATQDTDLFLPQHQDTYLENCVADYRFLDADAFLQGAKEHQEEEGFPWMPLRELLRSQILAVLERNSVPVPLGQWLADDLILTAHEAVGHVARRGSVVLGMPETTFRRRLEKVRRENEAGLLVRNPDWSIISSVLSDIIEENKRVGGETNLFDEVRNLLLQEVVAHVQQDDALGAALMGITVLTYRRWTDPQQREAV